MVTAYYIVGLILLFSCFAFSGIRPRPEGQVVTWTLGIGLAAFSGVRYEAAGDFARNSVAFQEIGQSDFQSVVISREPLAQLFRWLLFRISENPQVFWLVTSAFLLGSVVVFVLRFSTSPLISLFLFVALGFYFNAHNLTIQFMALAVALWSFPALVQRKLVRFVLLITAAGLIHTSAFALLALYPLIRWRVGRRAFLLYSAAGLASVAFLGALLPVIQRYAYDDYVDDVYGLIPARPLTLVVPLIILAVTVAWTGRNKLPPSGSDELLNIGLTSAQLTNLLRHLALLSMLFSIISFTDALIFARVAIYFIVPLTLLLPSLISMTATARMAKRVFLLTLGCVYLVTRNLEGALIPTPYQFFWMA